MGTRLLPRTRLVRPEATSVLSSANLSPPSAFRASAKTCSALFTNSALGAAAAGAWGRGAWAGGWDEAIIICTVIVGTTVAIKAAIAAGRADAILLPMQIAC